jgi:hypothetical protein
MFHYLLIGYIIIYSLFAIFLFVAHARIVPEEAKKTDKPWETPVDIVLAIIGLAGMVFLVMDFQSATVKAIWRPLSIGLVAVQVFLCLKNRITILRSGEMKAREPALLFADISTMLFLLPSFYSNIYYAFR